MDYDSDFEAKSGPVKDVDPYAGNSNSDSLHPLRLNEKKAYFSPRNGGKKSSRLKKIPKSFSFLRWMSASNS